MKHANKAGKSQKDDEPLLYYELHDESSKNKIHYFNVALVIIGLLGLGFLLYHFHQNNEVFNPEEAVGVLSMEDMNTFEMADMDEDAKMCLDAVAGLTPEECQGTASTDDLKQDCDEMGINVETLIQNHCKQFENSEEQVGGNSFNTACANQGGTVSGKNCEFNSKYKSGNKLKIKKCEGVKDLKSGKSDDFMTISASMLAGGSALSGSDMILPDKTADGLLTTYGKMGIYASAGMAFASASLPMILNHEDQTSKELRNLKKSVNKLADCVNGNFDAIKAEFEAVWGTLLEMDEVQNGILKDDIKNFADRVQYVMTSYKEFFGHTPTSGPFKGKNDDWKIANFRHGAFRHDKIREVVEDLKALWQKVDRHLKKYNQQKNTENAEMITGLMYEATKDVIMAFNEYHALALVRGVYTIPDFRDEQKELVEQFFEGEDGVQAKVQSAVNKYMSQNDHLLYKCQDSNYCKYFKGRDGASCNNWQLNKPRNLGSTCCFDRNPYPSQQTILSKHQCCHCGGGIKGHLPLKETLTMVNGFVKVYNNFHSRVKEGQEIFKHKYKVYIGVETDYHTCTRRTVHRFPKLNMNGYRPDYRIKKRYYAGHIFVTAYLDKELRDAVARDNKNVSPFAVCTIGKVDTW